MDRKYTISKNDLNKILSEQAKVLVGICMRRFEIFDNDEKYRSKTIQEKEYRKNLKRVIKELIYEYHRNLRNIIITFDSGVKFVDESEPKE